MAFKKSLAAFVFALPFVVGHACPSRELNPACNFLEPIKKDLLENLFDNECGDTAHGALRLSFHDAIGISPKLGGGGADGSIIIFNATELLDPGNVGIDDVLDEISPFFFKYAHVITPGDFIQLVGALSLSVCPGAPHVKYVIGRPPPKGPAPDFIVPQPVNTTNQLLKAFGEVGFSPAELVALLGSHTVAGADDFAPPLQGIPFDSTPAIFDTNIFIEVLLNGNIFPPNATLGPIVGTAIEGTIRLLSDFEVARDPRTACTWQAYALDHQLMIDSFGAAFFKMGLLGQARNPKLIDCSPIIPAPALIVDKIEFPPQQFLKDIDQSCIIPFPNLPTAPGPALNVSPIPQAGQLNPINSFRLQTADFFGGF
jgi:cytochrome c peroxidase